MSMNRILFIGCILLFMLIIPLVGLWIMNLVSNHRFVTKQWQEWAKPKDQKELNLRCRGYNLDAVVRHWKVLDERALQLQVLFLKVDLLYPVVYGVSFAIAAACVWTKLGRPSWTGWFFIPIALIMLADWAENFLQLNELRRFMAHGIAGLQVETIRIASIATMIKLYMLSGIILLLLVLTIFAVCVMP